MCDPMEGYLKIKKDMEGYRYLEVGEEIQSGDQYRDGIRWITCNYCFTGIVYSKFAYRRKIKDYSISLNVLNEKVEDLIAQVKNIKESIVEDKNVFRNVIEGEIVQEGFQVFNILQNKDMWVDCSKIKGWIIRKSDVGNFRAPNDMKPIFKKAETIEVPINLLDNPNTCLSCECFSINCIPIGSDRCYAKLFKLAQYKMNMIKIKEKEKQI
jgi:hypothetical protein